MRPGMRGKSAGGSRFDTWFDMKMQARLSGMRSRPVTWTRMRASQRPARTILSDTLYSAAAFPLRSVQGIKHESRGNPEDEDGEQKCESGDHRDPALSEFLFEARGQFLIDAVEPAIGEDGEDVAGLDCRNDGIDDGIRRRRAIPRGFRRCSNAGRHLRDAGAHSRECVPAGTRRQG